MGFGGSQGLFRAAPKSGSGPSKMVQSIFKPELVHPEDPLPELGAVLNNPWHPPNLISRNRLEIILRHSFLYKFPHIPLGI